MRPSLLSLALIGCAVGASCVDSGPSMLVSIGAGGQVAPSFGGAAGGEGGEGDGPGGSGGAGVGSADPTGATRKFVYLQSNDPTGNAVVGFELGPNGQLTPLEPKATGGTGLVSGERAGPLASDQGLVLSDDRRFLFVANAGSDSISVLQIGDDGRLQSVVGSPFDSNGKNPVSIASRGDRVYVVNKAVDGTQPPSYAVLAVDADGRLTPIPSRIVTPLGGSPSIAYLAAHRKMLFGTQYFDGARAEQAPFEQLDVFTIGVEGILFRAPSTPVVLPPDASGAAALNAHVALNIVSHPEQDLLYVGFPTRNQLGVFAYDDQGTPTFLRAVSSSGQGIGWFLLDPAARYLYAVNQGSRTLSTFDLADPRIPQEQGVISLRGGPSLPAQLAFDTDQRRIFVVGQAVASNGSGPSGNFLHVLAVGEGGILEEAGEPFDLAHAGVAPTARPQGVLVISRTAR